MQSRLQFTKLVGAGNDFALIDKSIQELPRDLPNLARFICQSHTGVGADGLLLFEPVGEDLFRIVLLNPDGSEATTCGNAIRCSALYAMLYRNATAPRIQIHKRTHVVLREGAYLTSSFDGPHSFHGPLSSVGTLESFYVHTGTDHAVIFVDSLDQFEVEREGAAIRYHPMFSPAGTNVIFVQPTSDDTIIIRTYERGVEAETLSCGSGSVAAALLCRQLGKITSNDVLVFNRTDAPLRVRFTGTAFPFTNIWLSGPAQVVYEGNLYHEFYI